MVALLADTTAVAVLVCRSWGRVMVKMRRLLLVMVTVVSAKVKCVGALKVVL